MTPRPHQDLMPGFYQHFKGGFYEFLGLADDPDTGKRYVVYRSLGVMENLLDKDPKNEFATDARYVKTPTKGELAVCSPKRVSELVDGKEFHRGAQVPRFRPVDSVPDRD